MNQRFFPSPSFSSGLVTSKPRGLASMLARAPARVFFFALLLILVGCESDSKPPPETIRYCAEWEQQLRWVPFQAMGNGLTYRWQIVRSCVDWQQVPNPAYAEWRQRES